MKPLLSLLGGILVVMIVLKISHGPAVDAVSIDDKSITITKNSALAVPIDSVYYGSPISAESVTAFAADVGCTGTLSGTTYTVAAAADCVGTYKRLRTDSSTDVYLVLPLIVGLMGMIAALSAAGVGFNHGQSMGMGGLVQGSLVIFVGWIFASVARTFVDDADEAFKSTPVFTGVASVLPLVMIGYALGLLSMAFGGLSAMPGVRNGVSYVSRGMGR